MENVRIQVHPNSLKELVKGNKTFRSALDFELSKDDIEMSRKELNETYEVKNTALKELKQMLSQEKGVRYRTDDQHLLMFLRYRNFDTKRTYKTIRHVYRTRDEYPNLFLLPCNVESYMNSKIANLMPYTDERGAQIYITKFSNWNTDNMTIYDLLTLCNVIGSITCSNPHSQINGAIQVWDFAGVNSSHLAQILRPSLARLWINMIQDVVPFKLKLAILFNCNRILYTGLQGIRYLLNKKIVDRLIPMRSDLSQLHEYVNPVLLPKEYGGDLEDSECYSYIIKPVLDNVEYIKYDNSFIEAKKSRTE